MHLPLLDTFNQNYEIWTKKKLTIDDFKSGKYQIRDLIDGVNDKVEKKICNALDAANHLAELGADRGLSKHIENSINNSKEFKIWRDLMPTFDPQNIKSYQQSYRSCNLKEVNKEIEEFGCLPSKDQFFFHGGYLFEEGVNEINTSRPLSTTLCPEVALRESTHLGKAYYKGEIHLYVLKIVQPRTKTYVYAQKDSLMGHEKEILFASGAKLTIVNKTLINNSYSTGIYENLREIKKNVPVYVIEVSVS